MASAERIEMAKLDREAELNRQRSCGATDEGIQAERFCGRSED